MLDATPRAKSSPVQHYSYNELFRLLDDAVLGLGLPDPVHRTAQLLIRFVPSDAPAPISPVRVQELAEQRHVDARTVRAHIRRLAAYGLVEDSSLGNGHRCVRRRANRIVALHGIDFSPMLARADELRALAAEVQLEQNERLRLRAEISALRRRFQTGCGGASTELLGRFAALPRRYAHLPFADLVEIRGRLLALLEACRPVEEVGTVGSRVPTRQSISSDPSEIRVRPNSSEEIKDLVVVDAPAPRALPAGLRDASAPDGQGSRTVPLATAHARSIALGVSQATWSAAFGALGRSRIAPPTLGAEQAAVRCPTAETRALRWRAGEGLIDLGANRPHPMLLRRSSCLDSSLRS